MASKIIRIVIGLFIIPFIILILFAVGYVTRPFYIWFGMKYSEQISFCPLMGLMSILGPSILLFTAYLIGDRFIDSNK